MATSPRLHGALDVLDLVRAGKPATGCQLVQVTQQEGGVVEIPRSQRLAPELVRPPAGRVLREPVPARRGIEAHGGDSDLGVQLGQSVKLQPEVDEDTPGVEPRSLDLDGVHHLAVDVVVGVKQRRTLAAVRPKACLQRDQQLDERPPALIERPLHTLATLGLKPVCLNSRRHVQDLGRHLDKAEVESILDVEQLPRRVPLADPRRAAGRRRPRVRLPRREVPFLAPHHDARVRIEPRGLDGVVDLAKCDRTQRNEAV